MSLLIRRINRGKWDIDVEGNDVSADAITNCLKTFGNDLSVWKISSEKELEKAILALITGKNQTKICKLHYVVIEEELLRDVGLELKETDGDTAALELVKNHRDICNLTYVKLGVVKELIVKAIKEEKTDCYTRSKLLSILKEAIKKGEVKKENLRAPLKIN